MDTLNPQEIRDLFAAAACAGILADPKVMLSSEAQYEAIAEQSWNLSDVLMLERAKRIEARKSVQP